MHFTESEAAEQAMVREMGLTSTDELFADVPARVRATLGLPPGLSELEVRRRVGRTLARNADFTSLPHFLGAGMYHHFVPPEVPYVATRSEFLTSYTPYQAEASQGMLQAMFEFQTAVCGLTAMDAANISMYDGASALAEAALMASRVTGRDEVLLPRYATRDRLDTVRAYAEGPGLKVATYGYDAATGQADLADLETKLTDRTAAVVMENPNLFGVWETKAQRVADLAHAKGALSVVHLGDPVSLGLVRGPGAYGADIVTGEGQPWGNAPSFGGPALGLFACKKEFLRHMPGRIVGQTADKTGRRAFCLTLQTREQHIRRERATSNICTNEGLNALMAVLYLATVGSSGLRRVARLCAARSRELRERVAELPGFEVPFAASPHFHEFVVKLPAKPREVEPVLRRHGVSGGLDLARAGFPELGDAMLLCVTEAHPQEALDGLVAGLREVTA